MLELDLMVKFKLLKGRFLILVPKASPSPLRTLLTKMVSSLRVIIFPPLLPFLKKF